MVFIVEFCDCRLPVSGIVISKNTRFHHGQLGLSLVFPPFDVRGGILVSTKASHVGSTD
jgi:hypothetical protein